MTCTDARHLAVTLVSSVLPEETDGLADLMLHNKRIQQGVYNDVSRSSKNVRTSTLLTKLMTKQPISQHDLQPQEYGNCFQLKCFML